MAQFDVYRNDNMQSQKEFPYLMDVQNVLHSRLHSRLVVPLAVGMQAVKYLTPVFQIENIEVVMSTMDMASVPSSLLGNFVVNMKEHRNDIVDALDFLVNGF